MMREVEEMRDESFDLRHSWRTFMVPATSTSKNKSEHVGAGSSTSQGSGTYTLLRPYRVIGTSSDEQSLFFLSLISPYSELLGATSHLFIQLNAQFRQCVANNEENLTQLRSHHEEQLTNLLEAANGGVHDIVVGSDVTQRIVLKHQRELDEFQLHICEKEEKLEKKLRQSILAFLKTSTPGAMALLAKSGGKRSIHESMKKVKRITNISHYVSAQVPVQTIELPNPLRHEMSRPRHKDMSLRPIVVDISPDTSLQACINSLYEVEQDTAEVAAVVEEHLLRLSHKKNAVLLLIGSQAEAESILSFPSAELLLQQHQEGGEPRTGGRLQFVSLRHHSCLKIMFTTRFWGANIIFLWTPPGEGDERSNLNPPVVEDALNLASAWNADMFSVAILKSSISSIRTVLQGSLELVQDFSMEVLLQLQRGIARLAYEATGTTHLSIGNTSEEQTNQEDEQWWQQRRWDDGCAVSSPTCGGAAQVTFNIPVAIRVFLPATILSPEKHVSLSSPEGAVASVVTAAAGADASIGRNEGNVQRVSSSALVEDNESFSSDVRSTRGSGSRPRHAMTFKKLIVYTFGDSVVIH